MRNAQVIVIVVVALLSLTLITAAQNQPLAFEVVSVRPVNPVLQGGQRGANGVPSGIYNVVNHRFTAKGVTLYNLVKWSFGITASSCMFWECHFLTGGPGWVGTDQ